MYGYLKSLVVINNGTNCCHSPARKLAPYIAALWHIYTCTFSSLTIVKLQLPNLKNFLRLCIKSMRIMTKSEVLPPFGIMCCCRCVGDACTLHEVSLQQAVNFSLTELCDAVARKSVGLELSLIHI